MAGKYEVSGGDGGDTLYGGSYADKMFAGEGPGAPGWTPGRGRSRSGLVGTEPEVRRSVTHGMGPRRPGREPPTNIPDHIEGGLMGDPQPGG